MSENDDKSIWMQALEIFTATPTVLEVIKNEDRTAKDIAGAAVEVGLHTFAPTAAAYTAYKAYTKSDESSSSPKSSSLEEATDEEVEKSIIPMFLDTFINVRKQQEFNTSVYNNIVLLNTDDPAELKNKVLAFNAEDLKPIFELTTAQLSSLVPVIEIYKVYTKIENKSQIEILLPFPDYTKKDDLDVIFQTRTGRGAGVGIKSFQWSSMAKNQANLAQFSAKMSIYLQDASELTKIRNQVVEGKDVYTASILDLLYPTNKGERTDTMEYDPEKFFLKVKVGWQVNQIQDTNTTISPSMLKWLTSDYSLTLYKHDIQFSDDGSVTLDIDFIAIAEAMLDDHAKSDIFFDNYVNNTDTKIPSIKKEIRDNKDKLKKNLEDDEKEKIENKIKELDKDLAKAVNLQRRNKAYIYKTFFSWLKRTNKINYIKIDNILKQDLKIISTYDSKISDEQEAQELKQRISANNLSLSIIEQPNVDKIDFLSTEKPEQTEKFKVETDKVVDLYVEAIQNGDNKDLIIPYFYLGDLFDYFIGRYSDEKQLAGNQAPAKNIKNKKTRLVFGTFSYSDYGNSNIAFQRGGSTFNTATQETNSRKNFYILKGERKVANIAQIPISFKSFLTWFNNKIVDSNLEKYTINKFIRDVLYDLVPANLSNRVLKSTPPIKLNFSMNSETVDDDSVFGLASSDQTLSSTFLDFLDTTYDNANSNYIIDFTKDNPFKYLRSKKNYGSLKESSNKKSRKFANYVFIFSNNEINKNLFRDYTQDINNNIPHFYVGEETGMIRKISFSREDNPRLDAHNIQVANQENQGGIVRSVYNAKIEMFGNNVFVPGNLFFLNPTYPGLRVGDDTLLRLGLGGYFIIIKIDNKIQSGLYTTEIDAKWQSFGADPNFTPEEKEQYDRLGYVTR